MPQSLPPKPSLEILKKQAKDILAAHGTGDPSCCKTLRLLHDFANKLDPEILRSQLKLHDAQFALALDYGFSSWADLVHFLRPSGQFDFASPEFVRNAYRSEERTSALNGMLDGCSRRTANQCASMLRFKLDVKRRRSQGLGLVMPGASTMRTKREME